MHAMTSVLGTAELLELILFQLDEQTLLTSAQLVTSHWRDTIQHSKSLQRKLFFVAAEDISAVEHRTYNPLLATLFTPWFADPTLCRCDAAKLDALPFANGSSSSSSSKHGAAVYHDKASWRRMLVSQPPLRRIGHFSVQDEMRPLYYSYNAGAQTAPDGLRMSELYDSVVEYIKRQPACEVLIYWEMPVLDGWRDSSGVSYSLMPKGPSQVPHFLVQHMLYLNRYRGLPLPDEPEPSEPSGRLIGTHARLMGSLLRVIDQNEMTVAVSKGL